MKIKSIIEKLSLSNISHQLNVFSKIPISLLKIIVSSFLIIFFSGFVFVFIYYTYLEFRRDLVIEVIDLPKEFQVKGYTNKALKKIIIDKLNIIEKSVSTTFHSYDTFIEAPLESKNTKNQKLPEFTSSKRFGDVSGENPPKLEVKLEGISIPLDSFINFFVEYIKRFFGCPRTHVVCNVTMQSNSENIKIITQIDKNPVEINNSSVENLDSTIAAIAEYIYKCKEPFVLAQYLYINGRQEACLESIRQCIQNSKYDDDHLAYNLWGRILYIQKEYDNAIKKYKMAIALYPKYAPAYYNWGLPLHDKGEHEKAIGKYKNAIEINARCAPAYFNWGLILHNKKDYGPAKEKYQMALKYAPLSAHPSIYQNLGNIFFEQENYNDGIGMCKKAIEINPLYADAYYNWGLALYKQKDFEKAIEELETATEIKPMAAAYLLLGLIFYDKKIYDKAIENYSMATKTNPNLDVAYYNCGLALYDWGTASNDKNKIKEAIEKYNKTLDLNPDFAPAYHYLGVALISQRRYIEAFKNFKKALEKDPKYIRTYIEWGNILCERKKYRKAIMRFNKALELCTDNQLVDKIKNYINELIGITKESHLK